MKREVQFQYDAQARVGLIVQPDHLVTRVTNVNAEAFQRLANRFVATYGRGASPFSRMTTQEQSFVR